MPQSRQVNFSAQLSMAATSYLWEHQVFGKPLLPGAGYFEVSIGALKLIQTSESGLSCVLGASIPAPLVLPPATKAGGALLMVGVNSQLERIEVASSVSESKPVVHLSAGIGVAFVEKEIKKTAASSSLLRGVLKLSTSTPAAIAAACASVAAPLHDATAHWISPSVLDNGLQLGAASPRPDGQLFVPAGVGAFVVMEKFDPTSATTAHALPAPSTLASVSTFVDYALVQPGGGGCRVDNLEAKPLTGGVKRTPSTITAAAATEEELTYQIAWLQHSTYTASPSSTGNEVEVMKKYESTASALAGAIAVAQSAASKRHKGMAIQTIGAAFGRVPQIALRASQQSIDAAGLWGLARTVAAEIPSMQTSAVDLPAGGCDTHPYPNISLAPTESDVAHPVIDASPYGCRVDQGALSVASLLPSTAAPDLPPFRLFPKPRGALQSLLPEVLPSRKALGAGRVFVAVKAVGINFRDVLNVLGMYPGDPGPPGGDCAGVITAVGPNVTHLKPGDAVFGLAGGCLGSHVRVAAARVVPMPSTLTFEAAATTPTVCITVDAAFVRAASVRVGETVLVHAAAGGVGLAAIQQAAALGGEVVATAGSFNKRELVRSLGAQAALGSRDTVFVSEMAELGGADVVLNSLTSSGMVAGSLASLHCGGRFVEISKRDIWSGARVAQERPDVLYTLVAVDFLPDRAVHSAMSRLSSQLAAGTLQPLPQVVHSMAGSRGALRQMSQARHVGKVVVQSKTLQQDHGSALGTVVVTGGLGMIGSLVSTWLAKQSAQRIVLVGRSGRPGVDSAAASAMMLKGMVASISMVRCDASSTEEVRHVATSLCEHESLQVIFFLSSFSMKIKAVL